MFLTSASSTLVHLLVKAGNLEVSLNNCLSLNLHNQTPWSYLLRLLVLPYWSYLLSISQICPLPATILFPETIISSPSQWNTLLADLSNSLSLNSIQSFLNCIQCDISKTQNWSCAHASLLPPAISIAFHIPKIHNISYKSPCVWVPTHLSTHTSSQSPPLSIYIFRSHATLTFFQLFECTILASVVGSLHMLKMSSFHPQATLPTLFPNKLYPFLDLISSTTYSVSL